MTRAFEFLLEQKVKKAQEELRDELNQQLYGGEPMTYTYTDPIITTPESATWNTIVDGSMLAYSDQITEQIFTRSPIMEALKRKAEPMSNDIKEVIAERRKARIEMIADELYGAIEDTYVDDGDIVAWEVVFPTSDKVYRYAARRSGGYWYVTNRNERLTIDDLIASIIGNYMDGTVTSGDWSVTA